MFKTILFKLIVSIFKFMFCSEGQLQKQFDACVSRLTKTKKKFYERIDVVAKRIKDFSSKSNMSDAETHVKELDDIQQELDSLNAEVRDNKTISI